MKVISEKKDLLRLLKLLKEANEESEKSLQKRFAQELDQLSEDEEEPEESEEKAEDEKKTPPKESGDEDKEKEEKPKSLPGADKLAALSSEPPASVTSNDIIERLNFIRAGASLSDTDVQKRIAGYVASLDSSTAQGIWSALDGLARIMLLGSDPAEVQTPTVQSSSAPAQVDPPSQPQQSAQPQPQASQQIVTPVVVGEAIARQLKDTKIPLSSGRQTTFGSQEHVNDLEFRISDMIRIRSYQHRGSQSKHTLSQAINSLKSELASAKRVLSKTLESEKQDMDDDLDLGE